MKKFITVIPFQTKGQLSRYLYQAVGNSRLQMEEKTSFPILCAISGYAEPGETFRVVALTAETADGQRNLAAFRQELQALCCRKGLPEVQVEPIPIPNDEQVSTHVATFQKLIDMVDDNDELFACVTYGTKPLSQTVVMAVQYAYRIQQNTSVRCIVYGQVDRSKSENREDWQGYVYDETALVQLDEIVRLLAAQGVKNPKETIDQILKPQPEVTP